MNSTIHPSEADRLYTAIRLALAHALMADMRASMTDDPHYWSRTGQKPETFQRRLLDICEDPRVFACAAETTEEIRAFVSEFAVYEKAKGQHA